MEASMCLPGADLLPIRVERAAVGFVGRVVLPSKWSLFRASHRDHSTHGSIVFRTPVGRRQGQSKKMCIDVSVSLHLGQLRSAAKPLDCRFCPVGSAPCIMDQKKIFSFGEKTPDQTSLIHKNSW
ncbi:uncharacterized protein LOC108852494 [Raphanus sativus]|uniref:Uncharacterized protein LOC108852494 n=1 Tax=Raphanus sativus TaxID=3726 RepID=A0A6J0NAF5_RAPSA|nr:uncharacterized protein LOC108852494 [Raphanus sativus]